MFKTFMTRSDNNIDKKEKGVTDSGFNFNYFLNCDDKIQSTSVVSKPANIEDLSPEKKKKGRPKKEDGVYIKPDKQEEGSLPMYQSNEPYIHSYKETNDVLKEAIGQIDILNTSIASDLISIRTNKSIRNKYNIISNLISATSALMSTKLTAVREINSSITQSHNLDMKRIKDLNNSVSEQDDDKRLQDLYAAYVNMPIGQTQMNIPNTQEISMFDMSQGFFAQQPESQQIQMTPELNAIIQESNPYAEEVVIVNDTLPVGMNMRFEWIDTRTKTPLGGMQATDPIFLSNINLDRMNNIATDSNLNRSYRLVIESGMPNLY